MITRTQVLAGLPEIHRMGPQGCSFVVGPRGGTKHHPYIARKSGQIQLWVTRPEDFSAPYKYGLKNSGRVTPDTAHNWCAPQDCPACQMARQHYAHGASPCSCTTVIGGTTNG